MIRKNSLLDFNWLWLFALAMPVSLYFLVSYRNSAQTIFQVLAITILVYLVMALLHHGGHKTLTVEIALEYVLTAALALIILQSLLF